MISGLRPHPVAVRKNAATRNAGNSPGTLGPRRGVPGLTLIACDRRFDRPALTRYRARFYARAKARCEAFAPLYRRRDMLGAMLLCELLASGASEILLNDKEVSTIRLVRDEDTGVCRVTVRRKPQRKGQS